MLFIKFRIQKIIKILNIIYTNYIKMSLNQTNYEPIQIGFCNYLKKFDTLDQDISREEYILMADDYVLNNLKDILGLTIEVEDSIYLDDSFDLIKNIRNKVDRQGRPTEELKIYKGYLTPMFTSNLKEGTDTRLTLLNKLSSSEIK